MGPVLALVAWGLSLAPILLAGAAPALGELSRLPLALLPWVALAGLPGGRNGWRAWPLLLSLSLPVLALAARLDRAEGAGLGSLALVALGGLILAALLAEAARRGGRSPESLRSTAAEPGLHGLLWALLVVAPPALELVLAGVSAWGGPAPAWPGVLSAASPLGWLGRSALEPGAAGLPAAPLAGALLLLVAVTFLRRRRGAGA